MKFEEVWKEGRFEDREKVFKFELENGRKEDTSKVPVEESASEKKMSPFEIEKSSSKQEVKEKKKVFSLNKNHLRII